MAISWGISARTLQKLEAGETVRASITESVQSLTTFNGWDPLSITSHEKKLDTFFRHILYAKYQEATPLAVMLTDEENRYSHSSLVIEFTLYLWIYVIHTQNPIIDIDEYYEKLKLLEPWMTPSLKELFSVETTGYYFVKGELKKSFDHFDQIISTIQDEHLKALIYFLVGASGVNEIQSIDQSIAYLTKAHTIFNEFGNYLRANRCNAFLQVAYIHSRRYQDFFELYAKKETYFHPDEDLPRMNAFIEGNLARYYLITAQYENACEVLRPIQFPSNINYFIYLVAAYQSQSLKDIEALLKIKDLEIQLLNAHHRLFLKALKTHQSNHDITTFIKNLKEAVDTSEKANDYIAYVALNPVLIKALKASKKYKEAYVYASKELDLLRQFH